MPDQFPKPISRKAATVLAVVTLIAEGVFLAALARGRNDQVFLKVVVLFWPLNLLAINGALNPDRSFFRSVRQQLDQRMRGEAIKQWGEKQGNQLADGYLNLNDRLERWAVYALPFIALAIGIGLLAR